MRVPERARDIRTPSSTMRRNLLARRQPCLSGADAGHFDKVAQICMAPLSMYFDTVRRSQIRSRIQQTRDVRDTSLVESSAKIAAIRLEAASARARGPEE